MTWSTIHVLLAGAHGFFLFSALKRHEYWKKKFAEIPAPLPPHLRRTHHALCFFNALLIAYNIIMAMWRSQ